MRPKSIKKISPHEIRIIWEEGPDTTYTLEHLRDRCPCAGCAGESMLLHEYIPPSPDRSTPGRYELKNIQVVGSYAVQMIWGDGHNTGIYTFEYLHDLPPPPMPSPPA